MTVYIAGPVTGLPDLNRPQFYAAASELRALGHHPIVPHDLIAPGKTWEEAMRACVRALMDADAVVMLRGWEASRGAKIERDLAQAVGIEVFHHFLDIQRRGKS